MKKARSRRQFLQYHLVYLYPAVAGNIVADRPTTNSQQLGITYILQA